MNGRESHDFSRGRDVNLHPVTAIWTAAGEPSSDLPPSGLTGVCALTGEHGPLWPASKVVSDLFTDWDRCGFRHRSDPLGFGPAAVWGFRSLRSAIGYHPHTLAAGRWGQVDPVGLRNALSRPLSPHDLVTVPVQGGKKHVIPFAVRGRVATDGRTLAWGRQESDLLRLLARLRALGANEKTLALPEPPWAMLTKLSATDMAETLESWGALDGWRADPAYLAVAYRATRQPKEP